MKATWTHAINAGRDVFARPPALARDAVYAVFNNRDDAVLTCRDAATGEMRWEFGAGFVANAPAVGESGEVYLTNFDGEVHALDPDGKPLWHKKLADRLAGPPLPDGAGHLVIATPGSTWCLRPGSGETVWRVETGGHSYRLAGAAGRVLQCVALRGEGSGPPRGRQLRCLSAETGEILWAGRCEPWLSDPYLAGDVVYVGTHREARAHDVATGALLGSYRCPPATPDGDAVQPRNFLTGPGGRLYFGDLAGGFHCLSASLNMLWHKAFGPPYPLRFAAQAVTVADRHLACLTPAGVLHLLDPVTGAETGRVNPRSKPDEGGLAADSTSVYVAHGRHLRRYATTPPPLTSTTPPTPTPTSTTPPTLTTPPTPTPTTTTTPGAAKPAAARRPRPPGPSPPAERSRM